MPSTQSERHPKDRGTSCTWLRLEVGMCSDGLRFLVNGRRVSSEEFEVHLGDAKGLARPVAADTFALLQERESITSSELAQARGLKLSTASQRLRTLFEIGAALRTPIERNEYRYEAVR